MVVMAAERPRKGLAPPLPKNGGDPQLVTPSKSLMTLYHRQRSSIFGESI